MSYNVTVSGTAYTGVDSVKLPITDNDGAYATFVNPSFAKEIIEGTLTELSNSEVTTVLESKFKGSTNLTKVDLPNVTKMFGSAFMNCTKLAEVNVPKWYALSSTGGAIFKGCTALVEFECCSRGIPVDCFSGCTSLKKVDFKATGEIFNNVGTGAFFNCSALETVILRNTTMNALQNTSTFTGSGVANGTGYIYVPSSLIDSYKSATNWSTYSAQFRAIEDYPDICG